MPQLKKIFTSGIMNKDADERLIPEGQYRHAENINVVNSETSQNAGVVKNLLSNKKLTNFSFTGTVYNITPKPLVYEAKNKIYWLCKDEVGCYLLEYNINNKITTPVLVDTRPLNTRVLNLSENFLITGIDILKTEDESKELLFWTDNNMQPCCVNIKRAKTWAPNSFDEEDILLIKKPPRYALQTIPTYSEENSNNILDKFISFAYRYKYLDGFYSVISSFTYCKFYPKKAEIDFQTMLNNGMVNQFNAVKLIFDTGDKRVTDVQLVLKESGSNTIYLIENFNKKEKGYRDNSSETFVFSNKKILTALPENELSRSFDNIPLKAKAQSLINNFLSYGNYVEFYDIPEKQIFDVSLVSNDTTGQDLLKEYVNNNQLIKINFPNAVLLKKDGAITFDIKLSENVVANKGSYNQQQTFYLYKDFLNAQELADDIEFIFFIKEVLTNAFKIGIINVVPPSNSTLNSVTKFEITGKTTTSITLKCPTMIYTVNSVNQTRIWHWDFQNTTITFNIIAVNTSLKSNRGYEIAKLYFDKYGRKSTALTTVNNTIYIDNEFSTFQNKLKITDYSIAPVWAVGFKYLIKQDKEHYNTIFVNIFYREGLFAWVKLEGDNIDKVKKGDTLIVKSDTDGVLETLTTTEVLEIETKTKDFIEGNTNVDLSNIVEDQGLYMKIKPTNFNLEFNDATSRTFEGSSHLRYPTRCFTNSKFGQKNTATTPVYEHYKIYPGTSIRIFIEFQARGSIAYKGTYDKRFVAASQYASVKEWFEAEVRNLGKFGQDYTWDGIKYIGPNIGQQGVGQADQWRRGSGWGFSADGSQFFVVPHREGTASRNITSTVKFEIRFTEGIVVFETEQENVENNIFFETEESFDIDPITGNQIGNIFYPIPQPQDKDNFQPAIIELDFFNCFVQGFGIESYRYKDKLVANALGIDYRPSSVSTEPYKQIRRFADITHSSEPYNESSNVNGLNNFNLSTANFKELDKQHGAIQLLHSRLGDVLVLQEEKAGYVRFGKQAIFAAEGEPIITQISEVLGDYNSYQGNNGIGLNPESFAQDNFRYYWFNTFFGTPIRLSVDGTTEINNGMETYFRNNSITFKNSKKIGAFDSFNKLYTLSLEQKDNTAQIFDCGNSFQKVITEKYSYTLSLNNEIGDIVLTFNVISGGVIVKTKFNNNEVTNTITQTSNITIDRNTLIATELFVEITPLTTTVKNEILVTNLCPVPIPLSLVLVVIGDVIDKNKTIQNRFRAEKNTFSQYEDTFLDNVVTKFEIINGFEGQNLFPINGDKVTIESVKRQIHTASFSKTEKFNTLRYLISANNYTALTFQNLLNDAVDLPVQETIQGIGQNNFSANFDFIRTNIQEKLYLIWDYRNNKVSVQNLLFSINSSGTYNLDVLANTNFTGTPIVTIITPPTKGTAIVNPNKTITYTHSGVNSLPDFYVFQVSNGQSSDTASVDIQINQNQGTVTEGYCMVWNAYNYSNLKMFLDGYIDFAMSLNGRNINPNVSTGSITEYKIDNQTISCNIPFEFTLNRALFNTNSLAVVDGFVLNELTFSVDIICNDASEISTSGTKVGVFSNGNLVNSYDNCTFSL